VFLGSKTFLHFHAPDGDQAVAELPASGERRAPGDQVTASFDVGATLVYPAP